MPDTDETVEVVEAVPGAAPLAAPLDEEVPDGPKKATVIVGNHKFPGGAKQLIIVAEERTPDAEGVPQHKAQGYPAGADIYYRTDTSTWFPEKAAEVITLGIDVEQAGFWGFQPDRRYLNVGPAHPAFGAANIAFQRGATDITIIGLSEAEKDRLKPFFDDLPTNPIAPAQVKVTLV